VLGDQHPDVADTLNGFAYVLLQLGDLSGAETQLTNALAIDRAQGRAHAVAYDHANLGSVLQEDGRFAEAEASYREALARYDPGALAYVASAQQGLGNVLVDLGRLDEAQAMLAAAEASWVKASGSSDSGALAVAHAWEGRAALASGRYADAAGLLTEALGQLERSRDHKDLQVRRTLRALVDLYTRTDEPARAEEYRVALAASEAQIAQSASADCVSAGSVR
jgi:tetratricopeptide (TPR) repeat protein